MNDEFTGMSAPMDADDDFREPPKWPKIVGIVSIVLASLGLLCNGVGGVGLALMSVFGGMVEEAAQQDPAAAMPPAMFQPPATTVAATILGLATSIGLLIGGIMTVNRKALGRPLHLFYAVFGIVAVVLSIMGGLTQIDMMQEWVRDNPDTNFARSYSPVSTYASMGFGVLLGGGYPIFCLIWFGAMGKRPEVDAPEII